MDLFNGGFVLERKSVENEGEGIFYLVFVEDEKILEIEIDLFCLM